MTIMPPSAKYEAIERFLSECCDIAPGFTVSSADLWSKYVAWCALFKQRRLEGQDFDAALAVRGFRRGALLSSHWKGLSLKQGKEGAKGAGL